MKYSSLCSTWMIHGELPMSSARNATQLTRRWSHSDCVTNSSFTLDVEDVVLDGEEMIEIKMFTIM
jgi:hypothetical protein